MYCTFLSIFGRSSRGRFPNNNNRPFGRRNDQMNGPSRNTDFGKKGDSSDNAPQKEEKDLTASDRTTTEDWGASEIPVSTDWAASEPPASKEWGADDWGSEKHDLINPLDSPSWAIADKEKEVQPEKNITNHVNHLPECDDDAILSSKLASSNSGSGENFILSSELPAKKDENPISRTENNLPKILNNLPPPSTDLSRIQTTSNKMAPTQPSLTESISDNPQPQRQQKSRTRRVQKSQIPKQPVEMPGNNSGMDSLDVQFGNLEFGGGESLAGSKPKEQPPPPPTAITSITISKPVILSSKPPPVVTSAPPPPVSKIVTIMATATTTPPANSVVNSFEQMSPRHYPSPLGTAVSKPSIGISQLTPDASPRKEKADLREPQTPPMTKKVDVSTSPLPLSSTMTASIAKNNNEGTVSRGTSLHSQIEAIATSDGRLDDRVHQQAPAIHHSSSPRSDQNAMRSRLSGVGPTTSSTTRSNPTPTGVSLSSSSMSAGPPPGIIPGIQSSSSGGGGGTKSSSAGVMNRQQAHGSKHPNLPPGVLPLAYGMQPAPGFPGFSPLAYPLDDIQMMQRVQMSPYYDVQFPLAGRDGVQTTYSGADVKYNRNDTSSPVPSSLTAGPHGQQAPFMNTHAQLHPFGYAGNLAFYHGGGMISGFAAPYTTQMYPLPTKGPGVTTQFQQNFGNQLGPHYTSGYDGLANAHDFAKQGYQHPAQSKSSSVTGSTASNSASDLSTAYKPQFADKAYLGGTPPPLNLSLSGQGHQPHPAGFPIMPVMAPTQHPPSLFASHHLSHQQQLDSLNPNRAAPNQGKVAPNKSHHAHGQSVYQSSPFWSGTN